MESRFSQEKWDFFCFSIKAEKAKLLKEKKLETGGLTARIVPLNH